MQIPNNKTNSDAAAKSSPRQRDRKLKIRISAARTKAKRTRTSRPYPAGPFEEALKLAEAIHKFAAGERVRRLTLLQKMVLSPASSATKMLITNSGKYDITKGSYAAEWLELTPIGKIASDPDAEPRAKLEARFKLAIAGVAPFNALYQGYRGKKIPTHEVLKDFLLGSEYQVSDPDECIDLFIVNAKFLGLLQTVAGAQMLLPVEHVLDDLPKGSAASILLREEKGERISGDGVTEAAAPDWTKTCFYITPIGSEDSEERRHADLFLNSIVEPALKDTGLAVVRADKIGVPGMITAQVLEYVLKSRLAIVDLSFHNPNVFYELAIRHASRLPVVHIIRKSDKIPFDVNQARAITIDTTDIFALVPQLETFRSQIATFARQALSEVNSATNPLIVFCPAFQVSLPA
jgi:hypothetical protein